MTDLIELALPAAILGPAAAGAAWLALARWLWVRRGVAAALWLVSQAGAWIVFWDAFQGGRSTWFGLEPDLLRATLAALTGLAVTLVLPRVEALAPRAAAPAVMGLAAGTSAVVAASFTDSLVILAVLVPIPTLAAAAAALGGAGRADTRGLVGLALADGAALVGLAVIVDRTGSTVVGDPVGLGLGTALVLGAAAAKAGAVPWTATWLLASTEGPGAPAALVLRAQGVLLALVVGFLVAGAPASLPMAGAAAALALAGGLAAATARTASGALAGAAGVAAAVLFVPLGLGGAVGIRAFLVLFPAFLLAAGVVAAAGPTPVATLAPRPDRIGPRPVWRWLGMLAAAGGLASLLGVPPAGGFPGVSLALSLSVTRAGSEGLYLLVAGGAGIGLLVALLSSFGAVRRARPTTASSVLALAGALGLLYLGVQPLRLGLGWLVRVEQAHGVPEVLASAGAPTIPSIGGLDLAWAVLPAALVVIAVAALGRGVTDREVAPGPLLVVRRPAWLALPGPVARPLGVARRLGAGYAIALVLEGAAIAAAVWVVLRGLDLGLL